MSRCSERAFQIHSWSMLSLLCISVQTCCKMAPQFTPQQRAFAARTYFRTGSYVAVQQQWPNQFTGVRVPTKKAIFDMKNKFNTHGTVQNRNREQSGRLRSARSPANIQRVQRVLNNNPRVSTRRNGLPNIPRTIY